MALHRGLRWVALAVLAGALWGTLAACAPASGRGAAGSTGGSSTRSAAVAASYACPRQGSVQVLFAADGASLTVDHPGGGPSVLVHTRSASGARFAAGALLFWDRGAWALVTLDKGRAEECHRLQP